MRGHVFVSYGRADRAYADKVVAHLAVAGVPVWYDHELAVGDKWHDTIRQRIDESAGVVVVMTPLAEESAWVNREIARAEKLDKPIFPLLLSGPGFFRLDDLHYEDVTGGRLPSAAFVANLRSLTTAARGPASPPSTPARQPSRVPVPQPGPASIRPDAASRPDGGEPAFQAVWRRISDLAGQPFTTKTGLPFTYSVKGRMLLTDRTAYPLHISQFQKAFAQMPLRGPGQISELRGPTYIYAILVDPRVSGAAEPPPGSG